MPRRIRFHRVLVGIALSIIAAPFACRDAASASMPDGGPDYVAIAAAQAPPPPAMVQVLPEVWLPETDVPAFQAFLKAHLIAQGAIEVEGEWVPWSPHRDLIVFTLKRCETGSMPWHERGTNPRYEGPHQWVHSTWVAYGGQYAAYPWLASIADQVAAVEDLVASDGGTFRQFPGCRARWGLP